MLPSGLGFGRKSDRLDKPMYLAATVPRIAAPKRPSIEPYSIDLTPANMIGQMVNRLLKTSKKT